MPVFITVPDDDEDNLGRALEIDIWVRSVSVIELDIWGNELNAR